MPGRMGPLAFVDPAFAWPCAKEGGLALGSCFFFVPPETFAALSTHFGSLQELHLQRWWEGQPVLGFKLILA